MQKNGMQKKLQAVLLHDAVAPSGKKENVFIKKTFYFYTETSFISSLIQT